jgi:hypothetical protein
VPLERVSSYRELTRRSMRVGFQQLAVPLLGVESFSSQTILLHLGKSTDVIHVLTAQEQDKVRILCHHSLIAYTLRS